MYAHEPKPAAPAGMVIACPFRQSMATLLLPICLCYDLWLALWVIHCYAAVPYMSLQLSLHCTSGDPWLPSCCSRVSVVISILHFRRYIARLLLPICLCCHFPISPSGHPANCSANATWHGASSAQEGQDKEGQE